MNKVEAESASPNVIEPLTLEDVKKMVEEIETLPPDHPLRGVLINPKAGAEDLVEKEEE